ncbi:MAG: hydrogenase formation protein HypD [Nitrospinae bacterium]|nr:hydrogenase formation protein HypD [Nitrospinota bacterium]
MKYLSEFRDKDVAKNICSAIKAESKRPLRIMEFCGGHTITLVKYGIPDLLPPEIELISGPGCPVCVTSKGEIDAAISLAQKENVALVSFGDMLRVPGTRTSLLGAKTEGADVRVVYSPDDAVKLALEHPSLKVVFFAVGFETTSPVTSAAVKFAELSGAENFYVLSAHKRTPPVLAALLADEVRIDAFVCPGHVTAVTGTDVYGSLTSAGKPCVVSGFEPIDILASVLCIVRQFNKGEARTEIEYSRVALAEGNVRAREIMNDVFAERDAVWRGLGLLKDGGFKVSEKYKKFDAEAVFGIRAVGDDKETPGCICDKILRGVKKPGDCPLFARACSPENPVGACMVSDEGTCSVYYRYGGKTIAE